MVQQRKLKEAGQLHEIVEAQFLVRIRPRNQFEICRLTQRTPAFNPDFVEQL